MATVLISELIQYHTPLNITQFSADRTCFPSIERHESSARSNLSTPNTPPFIATIPPAPCIPKHQQFSARN